MFPTRCCALGLKFLMLPLIVGLSYELNRWVGRHDNICSAILSWPGKSNFSA